MENRDTPGLRHRGTVPLTTQRLLLRQIQPEDAADVYAWMSDPEVCKYERWQPHPSVEYSRGYIREVFGGYQSDHLYWWGIQLQGRLIGSICAVGVDDGDEKATLGYCLAREYWSQGYATEALRAVLAFLFEEVGFHRLEASHSVNNPASGKVLRKAGLLLEGHAKGYYRCHAGFQDSDLYGLTQEDYRKAQKG